MTSIHGQVHYQRHSIPLYGYSVEASIMLPFDGCVEYLYQNRTDHTTKQNNDKYKPDCVKTDSCIDTFRVSEHK